MEQLRATGWQLRSSNTVSILMLGRLGKVGEVLVGMPAERTWIGVGACVGFFGVFGGSLRGQQLRREHGLAWTDRSFVAYWPLVSTPVCALVSACVASFCTLAAMPSWIKEIACCGVNALMASILLQATASVYLEHGHQHTSGDSHGNQQRCAEQPQGGSEEAIDGCLDRLHAARTALDHVDASSKKKI